MADTTSDNRAGPGVRRKRRATSRGLRLGTILGIAIHVDLSWIFIFLLVVWSLASGFFQVHPDWGAVTSITTAVLAAILFFASVLVHELSHSLVARSRGLPVRSITLFLFGGVSNLEREPPSARTEFVMAIVGPLSSLALGVLFLALGGAGLSGGAALASDPIGAFGRLGPASTILLWLGSVNVLLGLFNLVPGFPLDGGRVLRSLIWAATANLRKATLWAAASGRMVGWGFIFAGLAMVFGYRVPLLGTGIVNGVWIAFIGWFLKNAAEASYRQTMIDDLLEDVHVARLMRTTFTTVPADATVGRLVDEHILGTDERAFPVVEGERLAGIVSLADVRKVGREHWGTTAVRAIMTPLNDVAIARPDEGVAEALREMTRLEVRQLPVLEGARIVGLLCSRDIIRWLHLQTP
jgi:Zn-dependent protease